MSEQKPNKEAKPRDMDEKRWQQHLLWKKVMDEGQATPDTSWITSSKNLKKN